MSKACKFTLYRLQIYIKGVVEEISAAVHLAGLTNGPDYDLDTSTRYSMHSTVISHPNLSAKPGDCSDDGVERFRVRIGIDLMFFCIITPLAPKTLPLFDFFLTHVHWQ